MNNKIVITIYSKPGCHLCDDAKAEMLGSRCRSQFELREINIETDPDLFERYKYDIPVIFIGKHKAFKHRVTAKEFCERIRRHQVMEEPAED
jgi:glutaredoxin